MKYIYILFYMIILSACHKTQRAGSFYNPEYYDHFYQENELSDKIHHVDQSQSIYQYHSALNHYCTQYYDDHNLYMQCDDGKHKKIVPILQ